MTTATRVNTRSTATKESIVVRGRGAEAEVPEVTELVEAEEEIVPVQEEMSYST